MKIFYDIIKHIVFDVTSTDVSQTCKYQIVIYQIVNRKHVVLVSFCYEDLINNFTSEKEVVEKTEIYDEDFSVRRVNTNIRIYISEKGEANDEKIELEFDGKELKCISHLNPLVYIRRSAFNNYEYIEKTILDTVSEHEDSIEKLIKKVKEIIQALKS